MTVEPYDYTRLPADGRAFEEYVGQLFADLGYEVEVTQASRDFGADVILTEHGSGRRIAVQAKYYTSAPLGPAPVQEVACSLAHYGAAEGWVVTNNAFTPAARQLADENGVRLVEGVELRELVAAAQANRASAGTAGAAGSDGRATGVRAWRDLDFRGLDAMDADACAPCGEPGEEPFAAWDAAAEASAPGAGGATGAGSRGAACQTSVLGAGETSVLGAVGAQTRGQTLPLPCVGAPTTPGYVRPAAGPGADEPRYSLSELAGLWGVSPNRIRRMITEEGMPMVRMPNGRWEVGAAELAEWTRQHDARVERAARRERGLRAGRATGTVVAWVLVAALAVAAVAVILALVEEVAPGSTSALLAALQGLAAGLLPGAGL